MTTTYVLHGYSTRMYAFVLWIFAAVVAISGLQFSIRSLVASVLLGIGLAVAGWLWYWNPRVVLAPQGVTIVNPFRTVTIPWDEVADASGKWGLSVTSSEGKKYNVWAVPGRAGVRESFAKPKAPTPVVWTEHAGVEHLRVTAARAAEIIALRAEELRKAGGAGTGGSNGAGNGHGAGEGYDAGAATLGEGSAALPPSSPFDSVTAGHQGSEAQGTPGMGAQQEQAGPAKEALHLVGIIAMFAPLAVGLTLLVI